MNETLIFLHIPKAAGTTLLAVLEKNYPAQSTYVVKGRTTDAATALEAMSDSERHALRLLRGHMYFGLHAALAQSSTYITLLRDPIERVMSLYYYIQRTPNHYLHERVVGSKLSIEAAIEAGISNELRNGQVRLLNEQTFAKANRDDVDTLYANAQNNLVNHFAIVGLVEHFDETLLLLANRLGWKTPYYTKRNVTAQRPARQTLSPDALSIIEAHHEYDYRLYHQVNAQFTQTIATQGADFQKQLARFRMVNRVYGLVSKLKMTNVK